MAISGYRYFGKYERFYLTITEKRAILYLILSVITAFTLLSIILGPTIKSTIELIRTGEAISEINKKLALKIENLKKANDIYQGIGDNINLAKSYLPESPKIYDFITDTTASAENNGIQVIEISQSGQKQDEPELSEISIKLELQGSFNNIENFITDLEKGRRATTVESIGIKISPILESEGSNLVRGDVNIKIYYHESLVTNRYE